MTAPCSTSETLKFTRDLLSCHAHLLKRSWQHGRAATEPLMAAQALWQRASQAALRGSSPPHDAQPDSPQGVSPQGASPVAQRRTSAGAARSSWVRASDAGLGRRSTHPQPALAAASSVPAKTAADSMRRRSSDPRGHAVHAARAAAHRSAPGSGSGSSGSLRVHPSLDTLAGVSREGSVGSSVLSPFNSVLPPVKVRIEEEGRSLEAERADEELAQQLFRAAQARRSQESTKTAEWLKY